MGYRILESILVVGKGVFSCHTVKHMHAHLVKLNLYKGSYSACKEDLSRTTVLYLSYFYINTERTYFSSLGTHTFKGARYYFFLCNLRVIL